MLEFFDYVMIGVLIVILSGASRRFAGSAAAEERLRRMEDKMNVILAHLGVDYVPRTKERWQRLADEDSQENAAKEYSEAYSVSLEEAKLVVEQYLEDVRQAT